jgi:hypothetical protein
MRFSVLADGPSIDWLDSFLQASAIDRIQIDAFERAQNGTPVAAWPILGIVTERAADKGIAALSRDIFPAGLRDDAVFALNGNKQSAEFHAWVVQRAAEFARLALRENGHNLKALAEVRAMLEAQQRAFARLEGFFASLPKPHEWEAFALPGDAAYFTIENEEATADPEASLIVAQALPQMVRFPVAVDLMLRRAGPARGGLGAFVGGLLRSRSPALDVAQTFTVRAIGRWSRTTLGEWRTSLDALEANWTRYPVDTDSFGIDEPIEILIQVPASLSGTLAVGLAKPLALADYVLTLNGRKAGDRPLAVKVFEGIPGRLRRGSLGPASGRGVAPAAGGSLVLSVQQLQSATLYEAPKIPSAYQIVSYVGDHGGVLVHPTGTRPTIAIIRDVESMGVRVVSARVKHAAETGTPAECAVYAFPAATTRQSAGVVFNKKTLAALSWQKVDAQQTVELRYELPEGAPRSIDIFLLSRSPTAKIDSAWSVFTGIRVGA